MSESESSSERMTVDLRFVPWVGLVSLEKKMTVYEHDMTRPM